MADEVKKFYKEIHAIFPVHGKKEKLYLKDLKKQIEESEATTYDELVFDFGTPISIVQGYYDLVSSDYIIRQIKKKRIILALLTCMMLSVLSASLYKIYTYQKAYEEFYNSIPDEIEEIIVEED